MTTAITAVDYFGRDKINTIKNTVARGASDSELALFLEVCRSKGLDPFSKQVYYTNKGIITGIDGFRSLAEKTGEYMPGTTRFEHNDKGELVRAIVTVHRLHSGTGKWFEVEGQALLSEYKANTPIWQKMPTVMLAKCAEALLLRKTFPSALSGLYAQEEMDQAGIVAPQEEKEVRPVSEPKATPEQVKLARDLYADIESGAQIDSEVMALLTPKLQTAMMALIESKSSGAVDEGSRALIDNLHKSFGGAK